MCGTFLCSELMKAWPTAPTPGASSRPRAKSTSASGQAADAFAMVVVASGASAGAVSRPAASNAAAMKPANRRATRDIAGTRMSKKLAGKTNAPLILSCVFDQRIWLCQFAGDEVGGLIDHAVADVEVASVLRPVVLPGVRVGWVADGVGAVAQVDGPVGVGRIEIGDRPDPLSAIAEQRDRRDVL